MWRFEVAIHNDADFCLRGEGVHMDRVDSTLAHHIICLSEEEARTLAINWFMQLEIVNFLDAEYNDYYSEASPLIWIRNGIYEAIRHLAKKGVYTFYTGEESTIGWRLYELVNWEVI